MSDTQPVRPDCATTDPIRNGRIPADSRLVCEDWAIKMPAGREDLPLLMPARGVMVEVGVDRGHFAEAVLDRHGERISHYLAIDPYLPYPEMPWSRDFDKQSAIERLWRHRQLRFVPLESCAAAALLADDEVRRTFESGRIELVYIDGAHDKSSVAFDMRAWWPRVASGGVLAGHDYDLWSHRGVVDAVGEFAQEFELQIHVVPEQYGPCSWVIRKPCPSRLQVRFPIVDDRTLPEQLELRNLVDDRLRRSRGHLRPLGAGCGLGELDFEHWVDARREQAVLADVAEAMRELRGDAPYRAEVLPCDPWGRPLMTTTQ